MKLVVTFFVLCSLCFVFTASQDCCDAAKKEGMKYLSECQKAGSNNGGGGGGRGGNNDRGGGNRNNNNSNNRNKRQSEKHKKIGECIAGKMGLMRNGQLDVPGVKRYIENIQCNNQQKQAILNDLNPCTEAYERGNVDAAKQPCEQLVKKHCKGLGK